jgi:hypothetical protein
MVTVGFVTAGWTGAAIAGLPKIIDGLTKTVCEAFRAVSLLEPTPGRRDVKRSPVMEYPGRGIWVVANKQQALRAFGHARPCEGRRDVGTVACIFPWDVAPLLKGTAHQSQRHISLKASGGFHRKSWRQGQEKLGKQQTQDFDAHQRRMSDFD